MKKQLLIAAVAATMTSAAMADISITGGMKVNYKNTDANGATTDFVTQEADLLIKGTNGGTTVHAEFSIDGNGADVKTEDIHLSTTIGDVSVKTGTWNGTDSIFAGNATRTTGNWILGTSVAGVAVSIEGDSGASATTTAFKGDIAGVAATYKMKSTSNELYLSGDVAGFAVAYGLIDADAASSDASYVTVSKEFNGVTVSFSDADADTGATIAGDTAAFGDAAAIGMTSGDDASSIKFSTSVAGTKVSARFVSVDAASDFDVNTIQATRSLANGTTLEVTYTDTDKAGSTNDKEVLDIELAVKF
jgi:hypothetical protein